MGSRREKLRKRFESHTGRRAAVVFAGIAAVLAVALTTASAQASPLAASSPRTSAARSAPAPAPGTVPAYIRAGEVKFRQLEGAAWTAGVLQRLTTAQVETKGLGKYLAASGGCWYLPFYRINTAILWLGTSETWCGNGSTITYAAAGTCFGGTRYPTYNYFGCNQSQFFGAGWSIAQTETRWQVCIAWLPWPASTCLDQESPGSTVTYKPDGNYSYSDY